MSILWVIILSVGFTCGLHGVMTFDPGSFWWAWCLVWSFVNGVCLVREVDS